MHTFTWNTIEHEALVEQIAPSYEGRAQRIAALGRIPHTEGVFTTHVTVPAGVTMELPLFSAEVPIAMIDVSVMQGATLNLNYIHPTHIHAAHMMIVRITLEENARANVFVGLFGGESSGLFLETILAGQGASTEQKTLFFGDEKQVFDIFSTTRLLAPQTHANVIARGVATNEAAVRFDGAIEITQTAKESEGYLHEHTLLLSPTARVNAIPALKIATNEVKAGHSASVTQLDDEQLFYASSRGIPEQEAAQMIVEGFLATLYSDRSDAQVIEALIKSKVCRL